MGPVAILAVLSIVLSSCGMGICDEPQSQTRSPDGVYSAVVTFAGGCGGATTGYVSTLRIRSSEDWIPSRDTMVFEVKGGVKVKLSWINGRRLRCEYEYWDSTYNRVLRQVSKWRDVEIVYERVAAI